MNSPATDTGGTASARGECPQRELLADLLAELLDGPVRAEVETHVNGCLGCVARLEAMTTPEWLAELRRNPNDARNAGSSAGDAAAPPDDQTARLLESLSQAGPLTFPGGGPVGSGGSWGPLHRRECFVFCRWQCFPATRC